MTNDTAIRYLGDRDTCLGVEVSSCSFALELQRERAFDALSASRARFLSRSIIRRSPVFTCPLSFTASDAGFAARIEKQGMRVTADLTCPSKDIHTRDVKILNSARRVILAVQRVKELKGGVLLKYNGRTLEL